MCTILFAWQVFDDVPLVMAANRDEAVGRPSDPPLMLQDDPPLWGGRDRLAGGTWLAVDPTGRVCAVTNRHPGGRLPERDSSRSSRGQIPALVLASGDDSGAIAALDELTARAYNPVNVLYISDQTARWVGVDDEVGVRSATLKPGIHVLTEQNPDDPGSAKATGLLAEAAALADGASPEELVARWQQLLRSHELISDEPQSAACIHAEHFGTVSSSVTTISRDSVRYDHAEGHPCVTPFKQVLPQR